MTHPDPNRPPIVETQDFASLRPERPNANCPILAGITRMNSLTQDIQKTMRQLRRDLNRCKTCPAGAQCPVLQEYQDHVNQAIADVLAEFSNPS